MFAFLDNVYILCQPHRVHTLHGLLEAAWWSVAGIRRAIRGCGTRAPSFQRTLRVSAPNAWQPAGIKVLGTPIGSDPFVADKMIERFAKERESSGMPSRLRGSFSYRAQVQEQTTPCARCRHQFFCKDNTSQEPFSQCEQLQGIHIQVKSEYVGTLTTSEVMKRMQSDKHNNMFNVAANLKHWNTHENNNRRLVSALSLFVCSVSSQLLLFSLFVE